MNSKPVVYLANATDGTVPSGGGQIILANCHGLVVEDENCSNTVIGIQVAYSSALIIRNNTLNGNDEYALRIMKSDSLVIENNTLYGNLYFGMYLSRVKDSVIHGNRISGSGDAGIYLYYSEYCDISYNTMEGDGIVISGYQPVYWSSHEIHPTNTVNEKPVIFLKNEVDPAIPDAGQLILFNCTSARITDGEFSDQDIGIQMAYCSNSEISNVTCSRNDLQGIYLIESPNAIIQDSVLSSNQKNGVYIIRSGGCTLLRNTCSQNLENGIYLATSDNSVVSGNNCSENGRSGILAGSCDITHIEDGTYQFNGLNGIELSSADYCRIAGNMVIWNLNGINLTSGTDSNTIEYNRVQYNLGTGIFISHKGNIIRYNDITDNHIGIDFHGFSDPDNRAYSNNIHSNVVYGIFFSSLSSGAPDFDVKDNWGGHPSGPYHPELNPDGSGDNVTLRTEFSPWLSEPGDHFFPVLILESVSPDPAFVGTEIQFSSRPDFFGIVVLYVWSSNVDGELYNGSLSNFTFSNLSRGWHTISVKLMDNEGTWSEEKTERVLIHGLPTANLISVFPLYAHESDTIQFSAEGIADGYIPRYDWNSSLDGIFYSHHSPSFEYSELSNGTHEIHLRVLDEFGYWSLPSETVTVVINGRPRARIESIGPVQSPWPGDEKTYLFEGNGSDDTGITRFVWTSSVDGELYSGTDSAFSYSYLTYGYHVVTLKTQDSDGIWSEDVTALYFVNNLPTISISLPVNGSEISGTSIIRIVPFDEDTEIQSVELSVDGEDWIPLEGDVFWLFHLDTANLSLGEHTISARCYDGRNFSETVTHTVFVVLETDEPEDDQEGSSPWFAFLVAIITGALILFFVWYTQKDIPKPPKKEK